MTHHFHAYEASVNAASLVPSYCPRPWESLERSKDAHRKMEIGKDSLDPTLVENAVEGDPQSLDTAEAITRSMEEEENAVLLDLYVCCQCSLYVTVSKIIPGVIPNKLVESLTIDKCSSPRVGRSGAETVLLAWETISTYV